MKAGPVVELSFDSIDLGFIVCPLLLCTKSPDYRHVKREQYSTASEAT